jgi:hypothetical protein
MPLKRSLKYYDVNAMGEILERQETLNKYQSKKKIIPSKYVTLSFYLQKAKVFFKRRLLGKRRHGEFALLQEGYSH